MWRKNPLSNELPVGLIAGTGDFPFLFAEQAVQLGKKVILFGIDGYTDPKVGALAAETYLFPLGGLGDLTKRLKEKKIKDVVLAGGVPKKEMYNPAYRPDKEVRELISNTPNKGDDHLLKAFELYLRVTCGIRILDSRIFMKNTLAHKGTMTRRAPTEEERNDLRFGAQVAKSIGRMDIGQTVVVKAGVVLAVEALEGTDEAIRRGAGLGQGGVVVVKTAKPNQDLRFDLPCIGQKTLDTLKSFSSKVLGVETGKTVMIFKDRLIEAADRDGITLEGL